MKSKHPNRQLAKALKRIEKRSKNARPAPGDSVKEVRDARAGVMYKK